MRIIEDLSKFNIKELEEYCFNNFQDKGVLILYKLLELYKKTNNEDVASIISNIMNTLACYWEGMDFFELYFYEESLKQNPNSILFLEGILHFGLPPYNEEFKNYFDFESYKNRLIKLKPNSSILNKL